ncbi:hypothetical protein BP5796_00123 [Coleophoma crateriformis]|uniref:PPPDE domain-containing protein n=1 Tax=Coleophoma crateriformis TaxID=565419 RepID=A0A3D8T751_9HELO|nr:hypothetical protein BP5796_00123 [Coleophoma crateriformis]
MSSKKSSRKVSGHRSTLSLQKTEIVINVYDLLPALSSREPPQPVFKSFADYNADTAAKQPGRLASMLWTIGASLLHTAVVINHKEYAFGGHDKRGMTGVYWTKPRSEPPGGTFKCEILHGFTVSPQAEIDNIIKEASEVFQGTAYNLLSKNCNHFTDYLCQKLTGRPGPSWLNRAASIGVALPCVVPREWIAPPDFDTADGELLEDEEHHSHERSRMLYDTDTSLRRQSHENNNLGDLVEDEEWDSQEERRQGGSGKGKASMKDTSGRIVPASERAPLPRNR